MKLVSFTQDSTLWWRAVCRLSTVACMNQSHCFLETRSVRMSSIYSELSGNSDGQETHECAHVSSTYSWIERSQMHLSMGKSFRDGVASHCSAKRRQVEGIHWLHWYTVEGVHPWRASACSFLSISKECIGTGTAHLDLLFPFMTRIILFLNEFFY